MNRKPRLIAASAALGLLVAPALPASTLAAGLPAPTKAMLSELKLPESILSGLDKELDVPAAWLNEAKAGKKLIILSTWDNNQFRKMAAPF